MRLTGLTLPILLGALLLQVVTVVTKPGVCPACVNPCSRNLKMDCDSDDNCNGTQKCCQIGCVYSCKDPAVIKPGKCPEPPTPDTCPSVIPMKERKCIGDQNCTGTQKCCLDGCGYSCTNPEVIKPGDCPAPSNPCLGFPIVPVCHGDKDCGGAQKCCKDGCRLICRDPVAKKPGVCPKSLPLSSCYPWMALGGCVRDLQCDGKQKCCPDRCRHTCKDPAGSGILNYSTECLPMVCAVMNPAKPNQDQNNAETAVKLNNSKKSKRGNTASLMNPTSLKENVAPRSLSGTSQTTTHQHENVSDITDYNAATQKQEAAQWIVQTVTEISNH